MTAKKARKKLYRVAQLQMELNKLTEELSKDLEFENGYEWTDNILSGCDWDVRQIYYRCKISNGKLYTSDGKLLSRNGEAIRNHMPYFVNQSVGYCGDDYYGTMFFQVDDKGTFVAVSYSC